MSAKKVRVARPHLDGEVTAPVKEKVKSKKKEEAAHAHVAAATAVPPPNNLVALETKKAHAQHRQRLVVAGDDDDEDDAAVASSASGSDAEEVDLKVLMKSIVKIWCHHSRANFAMPWQTRRQEMSTSSGFVIEGQRILCNAHGVAFGTNFQVRRHGDSKKYQAKVHFESSVVWVTLMSLRISTAYLILSRF